MSISIGIDFGTSKTLVAWINPDTNKPETIRLGVGRDEIPTTVYLREDGTLLFGEEADDSALSNYSRYARRFKISLGSDEPFLDGSYCARDLTREFLTHIRERCEKEAVLEKITSAVIAVPAVFSSAQRAELEEAAKGAGFSNVELLREPIAAGMAYCKMARKNTFEGNMLVVDWGGGTLDLAIVSRGKDGRFEAFQDLVDGSSGIGGEAMDDAMWQLVAELLAAQPGGFDLARAPLEQLGIYKDRIRKAKEMLSTHDERPIPLATTQGAKVVIVSRKQFESAIKELVDQGSTKASKLIEKARSKNRIPMFTLLVGGTCKVPLVKQEIESSTKMECPVWQHSREAVAFGAAIEATPNAKQPQLVQDTASVTCPKCSKTMAVIIGLDGQKIYSCACFQSSKPQQTDLPQAAALAASSGAESMHLHCALYVRHASVGRFINAVQLLEVLDTQEKKAALLVSHSNNYLLELMVENKTTGPLRSPKLSLKNNSNSSNQNIRQLNDILTHATDCLTSRELKWCFNIGDEIQIEFANIPNYKSSLKITKEDFCLTWPNNKMVLQPVPVLVAWRQGIMKPGAVLVIFNLMECILRGLMLRSSAGNSKIAHDIAIGGKLEIGYEELTGGRNFKSGDWFQVKASGFLPVDGVVVDENDSSQSEHIWMTVGKTALKIGAGAIGLSLGS